MREITYRDMMIRDLANLNRWKFAISQAVEELETLNAEFAAIKATDYDKMPAGSGENAQEEKLITAIAKKDQKEAELAFNRRRVADIERLLAQLPDEERLAIEMTIISKDQPIDNVAADLGYEVRNVYRLRNNGLKRLCHLRHGASYQP